MGGVRRSLAVVVVASTASFGEHEPPLLLVAATVAQGRYEGTVELRGSEGVEILHSTTGKDTAIYLDEDLEGTANAAASASVDVPFVTSAGAGASVALGSTITATISDSLFGWYDGGLGTSSWHGPESSGGSSEVFGRAPSGEYVFETSGAAEGHQFLWTADVEIPTEG